MLFTLDFSSSLEKEFNLVNATLMNLDCDDKSPGRPIAPIPLLYKLRSNSLLNLFSGDLGDKYI